METCTPRIALLDTETTGLEPNEVIEFAWVGLDDVTFNRQTNITCNKYNTDLTISFGAAATHHILPCDLVYSPKFSADEIPVAEYLVGHNIDFDWKALGKPAGKRICTLALSRRIWPTLDSHSLSALFYFIFGMNELSRAVLREAHSAFHDVAITHRILQHITKKLEITSIEELYEKSEEARIPTHMPFGKFKGLPISEVDKGWASWYRKQSDTDPYIMIALSRAGK